MYSPSHLSTSYCISHIDLKALQSNYKALCAHIPSTAKGMAIIKNDAYGHGLLPCAAALQEAGAESFGVGTVPEGVALRKAGHTQEILILLGAQTPEEMQLCAEHNLMTHIYSKHSLAMAVALKQSHAHTKLSGAKLSVAIKCETGMSRLGFMPEEMPYVLETLQENPHLDVKLVVTHISCADMPEKESMVRQQAATFLAMIQDLKTAFPQMRISLCNSAASLAYTDLATSIGATVFRFGIALYGGNPFAGGPWQDKGKPQGTALRETMRVSTSIIHIYEAKAGQAISYGATFVAPKDMRIAVLGTGYADGFSRGLSYKEETQPTLVSINNTAAPVCGRVCMGTIMVDISHIENVQEGQKAWIVDEQINNGAFSMQALAARWGTISYEAFCLLGKNTRVYE